MILNCRYNMQFYLLTENFFGSVSEQNIESGTCVHDFLTQIFKLSVAECDIITVVDSASQDYFVYRLFGIVGLSCKTNHNIVCIIVCVLF